jgi:hypothetical protein
MHPTMRIVVKKGRPHMVPRRPHHMPRGMDAGAVHLITSDVGFGSVMRAHARLARTCSSVFCPVILSRVIGRETLAHPAYLVYAKICLAKKSTKRAGAPAGSDIPTPSLSD